MKRMWLVRQGKNGEYEARAAEECALTVDFRFRGDLSRLTDRNALIAAVRETFPDKRPKTQQSFVSQLHRFFNIAQTGDLVVTPMKTSPTIWIGRFTGSVRSGIDGMIERPVEWLKTDLSRDTFRQDLLYSFGAMATICEISRNNAVARVEKVLAAGDRDPGDGVSPDLPSEASDESAQEASDQSIDFERLARDQIEQRIASIFTGHRFTELVAAILRAQGYTARVSPPGADRGVDIVAGSGPLGLESPRVTVQVKSGSYQVGQPDLQSLIGSVQDTQADHGLFVSWGGFSKAVWARTNELYFRIRLWDRQRLVDSLLAVYDRLSEDIRAELLFRRTWIFVPETDDD